MQLVHDNLRLKKEKELNIGWITGIFSFKYYDIAIEMDFIAFTNYFIEKKQLEN